jgi:hypothetical protein
MQLRLLITFLSQVSALRHFKAQMFLEFFYRPISILDALDRSELCRLVRIEDMYIYSSNISYNYSTGVYKKNFKSYKVP